MPPTDDDSVGGRAWAFRRWAFLIAALTAGLLVGQGNADLTFIVVIVGTAAAVFNSLYDRWQTRREEEDEDFARRRATVQNAIPWGDGGVAGGFAVALLGVVLVEEDVWEAADEVLLILGMIVAVSGYLTQAFWSKLRLKDLKHPRKEAAALWFGPSVLIQTLLLLALSSAAFTWVKSLGTTDECDAITGIVGSLQIADAKFKRLDPGGTDLGVTELKQDRDRVCK